MEKIVLTADSTCDLSQELRERYQVEVVPLYVNFGEESRRDGMDAQPRDVPADQAIEDLSRKKDACNVRLSLLHLQDSSDEEADSMTLEWLWAEYPELMEEFSGQTETLGEEELSRLNTAYTELLEQFTYIQSYPALLQGMEENAEKMLQVSIFHEEGSFSYHNILKTPADFASLEGIQLKPRQTSPYVRYLPNSSEDLSLSHTVYLCMFLSSLFFSP